MDICQPAMFQATLNGVLAQDIPKGQQTKSTKGSAEDLQRPLDFQSAAFRQNNFLVP